MKNTFLILFFAFSSIFAPVAIAQNPVKEAMNAFAHFTKTQDIKKIEEARKNIDQAYQTPKDSLSQKTNLYRAMIYSALAVVDSNRNFAYKKGPLEEASYSFAELKSDKFNLEHEAEIEFIKNQLASAYLYQATNALTYSNFDGALNAFAQVDLLSPGDIHISHNLAVLYEKLGYPNKAIEYFKKMIAKRPQPEYYFNLSELYNVTRNEDLEIETLRQGRSAFPQDKDLVFKEINYFAEKKDYLSVIRLLPNALKLNENSIPLNYLAGFSYEITGNNAKAAEHYERVLNSDPNNYDGNYSLGLLYLNSYVIDQNKKQLMYAALQHLSKANEIDPNKLKTLQSLSILYRYSGDEVQLQRVNNRINQIKLN